MNVLLWTIDRSDQIWSHLILTFDIERSLNKKIAINLKTAGEILL